jgi:hypothetical protein
MYLQNTTSGNPTTDAGLMIGLIANDSYFYNYQSGNSIFGTAGSERMRITSAGNIGIGTTSPSSKLTIQDAANTYVSHFSGLNQTNGVSIGTNASNVALIQGYTRTFSATNNIAINADGGNVGIGTTSPAYTLDVNGTLNIAGNTQHRIGGTPFVATSANVTYYYNNSSGIQWRNSADTTTQMSLTSGGNVGIGNTSPSTKLDVNGDARFTLTNGGVLLRENGTAQVEANIRHNASRNGVISFTQDGYADWWAVGTKPYDGTLYFSAAFDLSNVKGTLTSAGVWSTTGGGTSDARTKKDIDYDFDNGIESILKLQPTKFKFKNAPDKQRRGFIAQDVLKIIPDLVLGDGELKDGTYGLDYDGILALAVKAIQEQQIQIEELKAKLK